MLLPSAMVLSAQTPYPLAPFAQVTLCLCLAVLLLSSEIFFILPLTSSAYQISSFWVH